MEKASLTCSSCGKEVDVTDILNERLTKCPYCNNDFLFPASQLYKVLQIQEKEQYAEERCTVSDKLDKQGTEEFPTQSIKRNTITSIDWKSISTKMLLSATLFFLAVVIIIIAISNQKPVSLSQEQTVGQAFEDIETILKGDGFSSIETLAVEDLEADQVMKKGQVISTSINGKEDFSSGDKFPTSANILIRYHSIIGEKNLPFSSDEIKEMDYQEAKARLTIAGFTNIELIPIYDLSLKMKAGKIDQIIIDGESYFVSEERVSSDAKITISYHAVKKDSE